MSLFRTFNDENLCLHTVMNVMNVLFHMGSFSLPKLRSCLVPLDAEMLQVYSSVT